MLRFSVSLKDIAQIRDVLDTASCPIELEIRTLFGSWIRMSSRGSPRNGNSLRDHSPSASTALPASPDAPQSNAQLPAEIALQSGEVGYFLAEGALVVGVRVLKGERIGTIEAFKQIADEIIAPIAGTLSFLYENNAGIDYGAIAARIVPDPPPDTS